MEEWKQIVLDGEKWSYEVSNYGNVRNMATGKPLKPQQQKKGYLQVKLHKNGQIKSVLIHRMVAIMFIPNPNKLSEVNHISEVKTDNRVENLEWCTREYNMNHGTLNERRVSKITKPVYYVENDVAVVYPSIISTETDGFCKSCVRECCKGNREQHKGKRWRYVK